MTVFGVEKVMIAYFLDKVHYSKQTAYFTSVLVWCLVAVIVALPIGESREMDQHFHCKYIQESRNYCL